jgi:flavin reductase (DIM6/NTAB) family NADH-FMN oxidoreductase RutF
MLKAVDHAGLVSGAKTNKAGFFAVFYGALANAPLLSDCPLNIACRVVQTMEFPSNELFVGEIVEAFCGRDFLANGAPDPEKLQPFTLTMPDNRYWSMGQPLGRAWSIGKDYKK